MDKILNFFEKNHWVELFLEKGLRILLIATVVFVAIKAINWASQAILRATGKRHAEGAQATDREKRLMTVVGLVDTTLSVVIFGAAILMALKEFGLDITPLLTGAGVAGVAVGFGAQSLVKDVISGFFILIDDQVRLGDVVRLTGTTGTVESIDLRTTSIRDGEGVLHIIPNGEIKNVSNMTYEFSKAVVNVYLPYQQDLKKVLSVLESVVAGFENDPEWKMKLSGRPKVTAVAEFNPTNYSVQVAVKTPPHARWNVSNELRKQIKFALEEAGVELPKVS